MRLLAILTIVATLGGSASAKFVLCCSADNDLYQSIARNMTQRVDTPTAALDRAADGQAVLILADDYPAKSTVLLPDFFDRAKQKHLRLYVEYPSSIPGAEVIDKPATTTWERGVIASDFFGPQLPRLHIIAPHDCHYLPVAASDPILVVARVAGYDSAVYGLPKDVHPLLFASQDGQFLFATTKLSQYITARYAPQRDWQIIWTTILHKLDPTCACPLSSAPTVMPAYQEKQETPPTLERDTFDHAAAFYTHARLLVDAKRRDEIHRLLWNGVETTDPPASDVKGDGSLGMIEGYASGIRFDGSQPQRTPIRSDCNAEAAMVLSLADDPHDQKIASNLLDYIFGPEMESMGRSDPKHPAFGMIAWGAISPAWAIGNYGDDDARVMLSTILASAAEESDRWDDKIMRALLANLRTTGTKGFRGDRVDIGPLEQLGWKHFHDAATINPSPHFESYLWACFLWAYRATGEKEFLDKAASGIRITMDAYAKKQWRWNDNIERARMILCLSWLVRLDDTPQHCDWLSAVARDLLKFQQANGAIREELGGFAPPPSNEAYGTGETTLLQRDGDPVSDQLYTTGFALLGLHEAAGATHDATLKQAEDKLADFLCRIQIRSQKIPYLDGGWFRAFDDARWDYWASSADWGWGAWSVEAGWGQAWIAATLKLREQGTTFWDKTTNVAIKPVLAQEQELMQQNDGSPLKR